MPKFDWNRLSSEDMQTAGEVLKCIYHMPYNWPDPDLEIAPDGKPYLYRWMLVDTTKAKNYFHIQVSDDPERPLHDHPWDNSSIILAGGYDEIISKVDEGVAPTPETTHSVRRVPGEMIVRKASWAHRLLLPPGVKYSMSLFSAGPKSRTWGFWYPDGWKPFGKVTRLVDGKSVHVNPHKVM